MTHLIHPIAPGEAVLATDFDGVVSMNQPEHGPVLTGLQRLFAERVARLDRIVELTRCRVVASTTWRWNPRLREGHSAQQLTELLQAKGFKGALAGITPCYSDDLTDDDIVDNRGREILAWCQEQIVVPRALAVLDDYPLAGAVAPYLVRTNPSVGLTDADVERVVALLRSPPALPPWLPQMRMGMITPT